MSPQQAIAAARKAVGNGSPESAVVGMAQSNPQIAQLMRGKTPQQACYELARQTGIPLAQIISMIGGRP